MKKIPVEIEISNVLQLQNRRNDELNFEWNQYWNDIQTELD